METERMMEKGEENSVENPWLPGVEQYSSKWMHRMKKSKQIIKHFRINEIKIKHFKVCVMELKQYLERSV